MKVNPKNLWYMRVQFKNNILRQPVSTKIITQHKNPEILGTSSTYYIYIYLLLQLHVSPVVFGPLQALHKDILNI